MIGSLLLAIRLVRTEACESVMKGKLRAPHKPSSRDRAALEFRCGGDRCVITRARCHSDSEGWFYQWRGIASLERPTVRTTSPCRRERNRTSEPPAGAWAPLARLQVPRLNMSVVVLEGSDDAISEKRPGAHRRHRFPGEHGNIGIAGHRDTHFRPFGTSGINDDVIVTTTTSHPLLHRHHRHHQSNRYGNPGSDIRADADTRYLLSIRIHWKCAHALCYPRHAASKRRGR